MAAGSVSLESALRTCKVDTAWASRIQSDRFQNPNNMVCPIWNGMDTAGRSVSENSFYTKRAGCNNATDRVNVENSVSRPQYMEYITLSANGIAGNIYTDQSLNSHARTHELKGLNDIAGNFGSQRGSTVQSRCEYDRHAQHQSSISSQKDRVDHNNQLRTNAQQSSKQFGF
jgi:hypothetical protein